MPDATPMLRVRGEELVDGTGTRVLLRGVGLGGWLNMENFITGYPANENQMREAVSSVLGTSRADAFFDRLLSAFFGPDDAAFLAGIGMNCVRIPVNYRHLESDDRPFEIREEGFRHLDRVIDLLAGRGIYSVIDLHALPGYQNQHWHSDNPTHVAFLWRHAHFQDRTVRLWEAIAARYRDNPWVAGFNPANEPADPPGAAIGHLYDRVVAAIRAVDPDHVLFLDGNTYATDFSVFTGRDYGNTVYVCHDYALPGFAHGGPYPGRTAGAWVDRDRLEQAFLEHTAFMRDSGTPLWVGEFGPVYTGDPARDEMRYAILADQLDIYRRYGAGWSIWTYKDVGLQGLLSAAPDGPYLRRFGGFLSKKRRLGADQWGSTGAEMSEAVEPLQELMATEFPNYRPYPEGLRHRVNHLVRYILVAEALVDDYAGLFRGLSDEELFALADSFRFDACVRRERLIGMLSGELSRVQRRSGA